MSLGFFPGVFTTRAYAPDEIAFQIQIFLYEKCQELLVTTVTRCAADLEIAERL